MLAPDPVISRGAGVSATPRGRGSRHRWGRCGARTRGTRAHRTCRAAGCGFGRRCALHGGLGLGALWGAAPTHRPVQNVGSS
jgi:hypothetical protein